MKDLSILMFLLLFSLNMNAATLVVTNTSNAGVGSLRDQIIGANDGDTIRFSPTLLASGSNSIVLSSTITFSTSLTIVGLYNSTDTLYVSGGNNTGIFRINNAHKLYVDSLVLIDGRSNWGGAIRFSNSDSLFVHNSILRSNTVSQAGGAIHGANFLRLESTRISNNSATFSGGGVYAVDVFINNSTITYNLSEDRYGGGVYVHGTAYVNNSIINHNQAKERGGGIYVWNSNCIVNNSTISNNTVVDNGGGIYSTWIYLNNSTVSNNTANYGGGIDFIILLVVDNNSSITNNIAAVDGGGIYTELGADSVIINNSTISYNTASRYGGGIYAYESSGSLASTWIKVNNSTISNNAASWGGGIHTRAFFSARFLITIDNSTLNNNTSTVNAGGAIYSFASVTPSWVNINNSTISNNQAYSGGGIYSRGSSSIISIKTSTISNNIADATGGGIFNSSSNGLNNTDIENSTIYENTAATSGSGVYTGVLNLKGSILFNPGGTTNMEYSTLNSLGYNIFNDFTLPGSHVTDSLGINGTQLDLSPLQNNGGTTDTHLPSFNSVAFNTGDPADVTVPQNSSVNGTRDRGAAEGNCNSYALNEVISCESYTWLHNGQTYVNDTMISDTIFNGNVNGCDSIIMLNLTIEDITPPMEDLAMLPVITSECSVAMPMAPTATDNCSGSLVGTTATTFPINVLGTTVILWQYDDGNGNISSQTQNVMITSIDDSVTETLDSLIANASGYNYQWIDCNNGNAQIPGATEQIYIPASSGSYAVEISNGNCTVISACTGLVVGLLEIPALDFQVYPNPFNGMITIQSENVEGGVVLLDNLGRVLLRGELNTKETTLDLSHLSKGIYYLKMKHESKHSVVEIIKQ